VRCFDTEHRLRCRLPAGQDGSVLLLVMGLVPILAGLIAVGTDLAVLFTHQRSLAAEADSAALAGAQAANLRQLYTGKNVTELPLDCRRARDIVEDRVGSDASDKRVSTAVVAGFRCRSNTVSVSLRSSVELPFASHFGISPTVEVGADAAARSPFR
jgi:uncharacterized membrane protein